jgi:Heterokaryon incompatibility protein (HET)
MTGNVTSIADEARQEYGFYQKHPITNRSRDIRLLSVQPGNFIDLIKCEVRNVNLDQEGLEYETLSYVWGRSAIRLSILVDDQMVEVTPNLGNALRYLRKKDKTIVLWIDALCINQGDKIEKTHQVGMMGEIYRRCSAVYIWLGCDEYTISKDPTSTYIYIL